jgi:tRNA wybutosine-synthesizing protein 4
MKNEIDDHEQETNKTPSVNPHTLVPKAVRAVYSEYPKGKGCNRFGSALTLRASNAKSDLPGVFGGMGLTTRVNTIDVYSKGQETLHVVDIGYSTNTTPSARMCHTTTDLGEAGTLLVGGRASPDRAFSDCWLYHKWLNTWERVDDLPFPLYRHQAVELGAGYVLVTPGRVNSVTISKDYLIWHRRTGWRKCHLTNSAPHPSFGGVAFCKTSSQSVLANQNLIEGIVAGGISEDGVVQNSIWEWSLTDISTEVTTPIDILL